MWQYNGQLLSNAGIVMAGVSVAHLSSSIFAGVAMANQY